MTENQHTPGLQQGADAPDYEFDSTPFIKEAYLLFAKASDIALRRLASRLGRAPESLVDECDVTYRDNAVRLVWNGVTIASVELRIAQETDKK